MVKEVKRVKPQTFRKKKKRPCIFCVERKRLDYKDAALVRKFMTDRGKIAPRRITGCCALHQRMVARAVKRARQLGLVPYVVE